MIKSTRVHCVPGFTLIWVALMNASCSKNPVLEFSQSKKMSLQDLSKSERLVGIASICFGENDGESIMPLIISVVDKNRGMEIPGYSLGFSQKKWKVKVFGKVIDVPKRSVVFVDLHKNSVTLIDGINICKEDFESKTKLDILVKKAYHLWAKNSLEHPVMDDR